MASKKRERYLKKKQSKLKQTTSNSLVFSDSDDFDDLNEFDEPDETDEVYETDEEISPLSDLFNPPKVSEMLMDMVEPLLAKFPPKYEDVIYSIAMMAWNFSVDPSLRESNPPPKEFLEAPGFEELLTVLIERKRTLFPVESRLILDFSIEYSIGAKDVVVTSVPRE